MKTRFKRTGRLHSKQAGRVQNRYNLQHIGREEDEDEADGNDSFVAALVPESYALENCNLAATIVFTCSSLL